MGSLVCRATGAESIRDSATLQHLWSGYGRIVRCSLQRTDEGPGSVIVKHVRWPDARQHPRGWNTDRSHERKVRSYRVESHWYEHWSAQCDDTCRVPRCLAVETRGDEVFIVLEDLDAAGFDERRERASQQDILRCVAWLANFHATFMTQRPDGLWPVGTYWHLDTRPDELQRMSDEPLRRAAPRIDAQLSSSPYQTFVHGDAKLANFCFGADGRVAAVDFQYVGGGCGMKDLAYFVSSCLDEDACEQQETELLDQYFHELKSALNTRRVLLDVDALEANWRRLYAVAWTDFFRFLQGWSPGHWKIHRYSERLAREVVAAL